MSIEGQGHFFTIIFFCFVCFVLFLANISGERLQDHWPSGSYFFAQNIDYGYMLELSHCCDSNEYPLRIYILDQNKGNNVFPVCSSFTI